MRQMASGERLTFIALSLFSLLLRGVAFLRYRFDSDEAQHLHVTWGWTAGLLPYRDFFDNHTPLFHMITAPILAAVGERPDVLVLMRIPMLLLFAIVLWATYILGRRLYSQRVAAWSTLVLSLFPTFFLKSLEYRTDNLWNAFWMIALVILTGGAMTFPRLFATGLLLGFAFATSMKTVLLMFTLAAAGLATQWMGSRSLGLRRALAVLAGAVIVPASIAAYFSARGAWPNVVYCVIKFNALLELTQPATRIWVPRIGYSAALYLVCSVAWRFRERATDPDSRWQFFFAFAVGFFLMTLYGFWLFISPRDFLPALPLIVIFLVAFIERHMAKTTFAYVILSIIFFVVIAYSTGRFENQTEEQITMINQVLGLTRPGEPIMDIKGETIFRPRPSYYIFEHITRMAMRRGLIADMIPEDVVRQRCYVAQADGVFFPPRGRAFLNANFLDMGRLRAAGQWIKDDGSFTIAVPGRYRILTRNGETRGTLDGTPYLGQRLLDSGAHRFLAFGPKQHVACLWAPASIRGFSPFHLKDREFHGSPVFDTPDNHRRAASR